MKKLLIATRNLNKILEIAAVLHGLPFALISLNDVSDLPKDFEVEENADSFAANAILKARTYGQKTGLITLADDSGLCVDALDGQPGILSARYAPGSADDRNHKLLSELEGVPANKRSARYVAVIAIYDPTTNQTQTSEGTWEGTITTEPLGTNGFGYDPIFFDPIMNKTAAQMTSEEKNRFSHRGMALGKAKEFLQLYS